MIGINLKAIVLKAAKAGVELTMSFEGGDRVVLRARRGIFTINYDISAWEVNPKIWQQGDQFMRIVEDLIYRLDDAEQKRIETGGTEK